MSSLLSTALFAMTASAALTTTIRGPFFGGDDETYTASLIGVEKPDRTTIALEMTYQPGFDTSVAPETETQTLTWFGSTRIEAISSTSDIEGMGPLSVKIQCDMPTKGDGACTYSYGGDYFKNNYCASYTGIVTETYTEEYDGTTSIYEETYDYRSMFTSAGIEVDAILDMCTGNGKIPKELAVFTETLSKSDMSTATVVITAGDEKLRATAGATPNGNGPEPTGTQVEVESPSKTGAAGAPESTGAAVLNAVPALAGLGAAVAAFML